MNTIDFIKLYKSNPCRYSAAALWKTLLKENLEIHSLEDNSGIKSIRVYDDSTLFLYWDKENNLPEDMEKYNLSLFHVKQLEKPEQIKEKADCYFRLKHSGNTPITNDKNIQLKNVDIAKEAKEVSEFICKCYKDLKPDEHEVISWTKRKVFNNDLWVWAADSITGEYIGLGIAEYDQSIMEGSLEWIQVLQEHSGKGVGKAVVCELINRMTYADFITVSGRKDNPAAENCIAAAALRGMIYGMWEENSINILIFFIPARDIILHVIVPIHNLLSDR